MVETLNDPWESAEKATWNPTNTFFGQCKIDVWYCYLEKGTGKVPFDPNAHPQDRRRTAVDFHIFPVSDNVRFPIKRDLIAESREWVQITKPSITALGLDLRQLQDRYVQIELVPNGTYTDKNGQEKQLTALKFVKVFISETECRQAADAFFTRHDGSEPSGTTSAEPAQNGSTAADPQRATLAKFLPTLWAACGKDPHKFGEKLLSDPTLSRYFKLTDPEVIDLVSKG